MKLKTKIIRSVKKWKFNKLGYAWSIGMISLVSYGNVMTTNTKLISPAVLEPIQVEAKAPQVKISCETPRGYLECQMYKGIITEQEYNLLEKIFQCESKFNPEATGTNIHADGSVSIDRGIAQINNRYHKKLNNADAYDFKKNIDYAIALYKRSGANQWSCYKLISK
jgi:hypothetical protein